MPLKILHCINSLDAIDGGPARSVPALATAEAQHGADVRICSARTSTIDLREYPNVRFLSGNPQVAISSGWIPDIIHDHGLWLSANHLNAKLGRHKRIPRIVAPKGMLAPWCLKHRRIKKQIAWWLYQHRDLRTAAGIHVTSDTEAEQVRRLGLINPIINVPHGLTLPNPTAQDWQSPPEATTTREILFLSRIHPVKGLFNLIDAWQQCQRDDWRLRIVGPDEDGHRRRLEAVVAAKDLSGSVKIEDGVHSNRKWQMLRRADVVVLPSFSENFGIIVAESLAVGTPVITTTGTPWERVIAKRCGWYVEPTASGLNEALTAAMNTSVSELHEMGRHGERWIRQDFAWADIGKQMISAYDWLLGAGGDTRSIQQATRREAA